MTSLNIARLTIAFLTAAHAVDAQPPVRTAEVSKPDAARTVTLSLVEYNRLMDLASRPPQGPSLAPLGAVLASAELRVRVDHETAQGVFSLVGDVLRPGVNRVALVSGATLIEGSASGRPLPLSVDGTMHTALLSGPGPFALTLEWGARLTFAPGRASFTLPVPPAGTARATIDLPGDQADVHVSAGLVTRRSTTNGRTTVDVTLRPGTATEVWWSMRDSAPVAAAREVRTLADVMTLVTIGDSDVRMVALVDVTVVQGEPRAIEVRLPPGYEVTGISGSSLESSDQRDGGVMLTVGDPAARRHQFLVSLERPHEGGSFTLDTGFPSLPDAQRERGEIAIEGVGTLELSANGRGPGASGAETSTGSMHRIDVRELNAALQSLARLPILSAFRYQRSATAPTGLTMDVKRFADAGVLAAVADRAVATTLVTTEGRALTEIALQVQNRAQPFLKVALPAGATMVSVDVAGEAAKPMVGADGTRVPLLRPGFRPNGTYRVSFVYMHAGTPFLRKGDFQMALPKMDIPVSIVEWEVFVPEQYSVRAIDGNVIDRSAFPAAALAASVPEPYGFGSAIGVGAGSAGGTGGGIVGGVNITAVAGLSGQIRGRATDRSGAVVPGVTIAIEVEGSRRAAVTGADGTYLLSGVPSGPATITAQLVGFQTQRRSFAFDQAPKQVDFVMSMAAVEESVTISANASGDRTKGREAQKAAEPPSQNVINLQRRAAGVLPVRVDVPRAGVSHQFVKPLVVDQETVVTLRYKRR
ncbi:MAG TPA: carboxypeptidase-like regulatory domain-containing protein [Vicinamibacterales bacterium]|nr:carboxypeptidase-like regulatory domain-containing protein [Vicinamibacterales bacterium]